jgi:hypothetical protein
MGDHTVPKGKYRSAMTRIQAISFNHVRAFLPALWLLVLELQQTLTQHAIFPSRLSGEGKLLPYSRCLSEIMPVHDKRLYASLGAPQKSFAFTFSSLREGSNTRLCGAHRRDICDPFGFRR